MLATRLPGILPPMTEEEALETAMVRSVSTLGFESELWGLRPFRAPHHSASGAAIVGGGVPLVPGKSPCRTMESCFSTSFRSSRESCSKRSGTARVGHRHDLARGPAGNVPARFQLVAAMNPCPCGTLGDPAGTCRCSFEQISRYRARISGPLLDRVDLHVEVPRIRDHDECAPAEPSSRCANASPGRGRFRFNRARKPNQRLSVTEIRQFCELSTGTRRLLSRATDTLHLSARARDRILRSPAPLPISCSRFTSTTST